MPSKSDIIERLIREASPRLAVVFAGAEPRLIGTLDHERYKFALTTAAAVKPEVDAMLIAQSLSATHISRATCRDAPFIACHS